MVSDAPDKYGSSIPAKPNLPEYHPKKRSNFRSEKKKKIYFWVFPKKNLRSHLAGFGNDSGNAFQISRIKKQTMRYYKKTDNIISGRIDSTDDNSKFRLHQKIKNIDVFDKTLKIQEKRSFGIVSYCVDEGVKRNKGREGTKEGPEFVKKHLASKPFHYDGNIYDCGRIVQEDNNLEEMQKELSMVIKRLTALNIFPIVIGGGHDVLYGSAKGIENQPGNIGIISFDAHFDNRQEDRSTSGTAFNQLAETTDIQTLAIGISEISNTKSLFTHADLSGIEYIKDDDFNFKPTNTIIKQVNEFIQNKDKIHITICTDVFPSYVAPGVSAPSGIGIDLFKFAEVFRFIVQTGKVISFDIAEISPRLDVNESTATLGATIISKLINYIFTLEDEQNK